LNLVKLSVLITCYNRQEYIAEAIESVLTSSYKDFELIISDDCSNDQTVQIAKVYEKEDVRVKVFMNEVNLGQFANRNKAASYAIGQYIKYVDSDDVIYPYSLQIMMDAMIRYPEAGLGFCTKYKDSKRSYPYIISPAEALITHYLKEELLMIGPSGLIISRHVFEEVKGFEEYGMPSDNHLTLKIAAKYPVVALQRDLFWWRPHAGQIFTLDQLNPTNILNNYLYNTDILINHSPLTTKENNQIIKNQKKIFYINILKLFFKQYKPLTALSLFHIYLKKRRV
jgi:glycosyltransferase involved in cell wall biosynthesis